MTQTLTISTPTFDLNGVVSLKISADSELKTNSRRVSRSATLDGGVVITDGGYSDGDRTFRVNYRDMSQEDEAKLWEIFKNYSQVIISNIEGCFSGVLEYVKCQNGSGTVSIMYKERLSQ
jgi:hypothetical protein